MHLMLTSRFQNFENQMIKPSDIKTKRGIESGIKPNDSVIYVIQNCN